MADGHLQFLWTPQGYELHEAEGDAPPVGETVEAAGKTWHVLKVAQSPLPGDDRTCVYLTV